MSSVASRPRKRDGKRQKFRVAPDFSAGSPSRERLEALILSVVPEAERPKCLKPDENLPAIYARFRTGNAQSSPDEIALVGHQMRLEAGLIQAPVLGRAGQSLAQLPNLLCDELEEANMRFSVAMQTLRVAATVYRLFQLWSMRELREPVPLQLEPNFVRKWMRFPNEGPRLCEDLKELFLRPRLENPKFRQQRARAEKLVADCSYPDLSVAQVIRALQWLRVLKFVRPIQHFLLVKGWHGIPRFELVACPMQNVPELAYPTFEDEVRKRAKRKRAKVARMRLDA